jgi:hypothetical protein
MTEKEFEQLKAGDKVWIYHGFLSEAVVISKQENCVEFKADSLLPTKFNHKFVGITKSQAIEGEIELQEKYVELAKTELGQRKATLSALKDELAKVKEEETVVWVVDFDKGEVVRSTKKRWEASVENYEWTMGSARYKPCETEHEAYIVLARHYEKKLAETEAKLEEVKNRLSNIPAIPKQEEETK